MGSSFDFNHANDIFADFFTRNPFEDDDDDFFSAFFGRRNGKNGSRSSGNRGFGGFGSLGGFSMFGNDNFFGELSGQSFGSGMGGGFSKSVSTTTKTVYVCFYSGTAKP